MLHKRTGSGLVAAAAVPPTLLIVMHHPVLGAATLGLVLGAWVLHARMILRADQERDARLLDYAHLTANLGGDPTPVISVLRRPGADPDDELYRPEDDERPWVHLRPSDY